MGCQSVLVTRWSVVRDLNPGRRSMGGRRRRKVGAPSRAAACCPPAMGDENCAHGVTGFSPLQPSCHPEAAPAASAIGPVAARYSSSIHYQCSQIASVNRLNSLNILLTSTVSAYYDVWFMQFMGNSFEYNWQREDERKLRASDTINVYMHVGFITYSITFIHYTNVCTLSCS